MLVAVWLLPTLPEPRNRVDACPSDRCRIRLVGWCCYCCLACRMFGHAQTSSVVTQRASPVNGERTRFAKSEVWKKQERVVEIAAGSLVHRVFRAGPGSAPGFGACLVPSVSWIAISSDTLVRIEDRPSSVCASAKAWARRACYHDHPNTPRSASSAGDILRRAARKEDKAAVVALRVVGWWWWWGILRRELPLLSF